MRQIELLRDRHVPDLAECGALTQIEDTHVRCNASAVMLVRIDGFEDYVCRDHLTKLCREREKTS